MKTGARRHISALVESEGGRRGTGAATAAGALCNLVVVLHSGHFRPMGLPADALHIRD